MMRDDVIKFLNKRVRVTIENGYNFTGNVISVSADVLSILDKFNMPVVVRLDDISFIVEVKP